VAVRILQQTGSFVNDINPNVSVGIDLPFRRGEDGDGYFATSKTTIDSVKNDLRLLLNTHQGERFFRPTLGINLRKYLFEQYTVDTVLNIQNDILDTITTYLPFVSVRDIQVSMDEKDSIGKNKITVKIIFFIQNDPGALSSVDVDVTSGE